MRPEMTSDAWVICVRAAGSDAVLARYRKELGSAITRELDGEGEAKHVAGDREIFRSATRSKPSHRSPNLMARYNVIAPLSDVCGGD